MAAKIVFTTDNSLLFVGGAVATQCVKENVEFLRTQCTYEGQIQINQNIILIHEDVKALLSAEEFKAVVLHEKGHIRHQHLAKMAATGATGIFDNNDFELEADRYAAKRVDPRAMISGLVKLIRNTIIDAPKEVRDQVWKAVHKTGRIQALLAMR